MNDSTLEISPIEETLIYLKMLARQMQTANMPTA